MKCPCKWLPQNIGLLFCRLITMESYTMPYTIVVQHYGTARTHTQAHTYCPQHSILYCCAILDCWTYFFYFLLCFVFCWNELTGYYFGLCVCVILNEMMCVDVVDHQKKSERDCVCLFVCMWPSWMTFASASLNSFYSIRRRLHCIAFDFHSSSSFALLLLLGACLQLPSRWSIRNCSSSSFFLCFPKYICYIFLLPVFNYHHHH